MFYPKGKIRHFVISNIIQNSKSYQQIRFNSGLINNNNEDNDNSYTSKYTNNENSVRSYESEFASKVILYVKTPREVKTEIEYFVNGDFKNFKNLTIPLVSNQKVLPRKTEYKSFKSLNELMDNNQVKKAIELVNSTFNAGVYLTLFEFQNLFIQLLPFNWYAYKLLKTYEEKIDFTKINNKVLVLFMKVSYSNFDFILFNKMFQIFQNQNEKIPTAILLSAIQIYLKTENIPIATQLFNQQVLTETELPNRVLDLFISNLYNQSKNINLCLTSYRLWLSKNLNTNISIDSFIYNLVLESESLEDIQWIENSLTERNRLDKFSIKFGNLCNKLSKNFKDYENFINSEELTKFKKLAEEENEKSLLLNNLTYLHLRHSDYKSALETFKNVDNKKDLQLCIFSILRHFEKEQKPEMIFKMLKNLRNDCKYVIIWSHIIIYWRTIIKKYPHLGLSFYKIFQRRLKKSKYHRYSFLSKILFINKQRSKDIKEPVYYPVIKYDKLETELKPLNSLPNLENIKSRLKFGILPNSELLRKSIKLTDDKLDFHALVEIANELNLKNNSEFKNIGLNVEIFYKESSLNGSKVSIKDFINEQIDLIKSTKFVSNKDLGELFKISVKCKLVDETVLIFKLFDEFNFKVVGDQEILKFLSIFIKWCWANKKFIDLAIILNWLEKQNDLKIDNYFWLNLEKAANENLIKIDHEISNFNKLKLTDGELIEKENERKYFRNILPQVVAYYNKTLNNIKTKNEVEKKEIINEVDNCFNELIEWVDEDTEALFDGDWSD